MKDIKVVPIKSDSYLDITIDSLFSSFEEDENNDISLKDLLNSCNYISKKISCAKKKLKL